MALYDNSTILEFLDGTTQLIRIPDTETKTLKTTHILIDGETLQDLSFRYYGNSQDWYRIADFNDILNPFELESGTVINIPL